MKHISYTSVLPTAYRADLESLLFLNPGQPRMRDAILAAIEAHGVPEVVAEGDRLRVHLRNGPEVQTLYAMAETEAEATLIGALVYTRLDATTILVLHVAVEPEYASQGRLFKQMIVLKFISQLREIAARIKGVSAIRIIYGGAQFQDIPV
jgi:hypothetical protein